MTKSVMVGISRSGNVAAVSVMMAGWKLSFSSLLWKICQMILVQGHKCSLPSQCTGPGSQSWFHAPGLVFFNVYYFCTYWAWRLVPCSRQSGSSIHYLHVGGVVLIWPLPQLFSIFSCSYVKFEFCVCRHLQGLIKTEICINTLLSRLLDG